jgi:hypothetical protein
MNNIVKEQSQPHFIRLLKAQRVVYSKAKYHYWIDSVSLLLAISSVLLSILKIDYKTLLVILSVIWWVICFFLVEYRTIYTKKGAIIQEMFDVELFKLDWNFIKLPQKVLGDEIVKLSKFYTKTDLDNWYSPLIPIELPQSIAVLLCYKNNVAWGISNKDKFKQLITFLGIGYLVMIIGYAIIIRLSLPDFFVLIAPSLAFLKYCYDTSKNLDSYIRKHQELNNIIEKFLDYYITSKIEPTQTELRQLQDEFFTQRSTPNEVPNWFYFYHRGKTNEDVDDILKNIINKINIK